MFLTMVEVIIIFSIIINLLHAEASWYRLKNQ